MIVLLKKISARFQLENWGAPARARSSRNLLSSSSLEPENSSSNSSLLIRDTCSLCCNFFCNGFLLHTYSKQFHFFFFSFEEKNTTIDGYFTEMSCIQFYRIYIERKCIFPFFFMWWLIFFRLFICTYIAFKFRNLTSLHWGLSCHLHKFRAGGTMGQGGHCPPHILTDSESKSVPSNSNLHITSSPSRFSVFPPSLNNAVGRELANLWKLDRICRIQILLFDVC